MTLYLWSQTASTNALIDETCPWPEGMDPAQINDSARGMMAATAKYRDDVSGQIVTTGSSSAYSVMSFQGFDGLADMHGKVIWFSPHTTNIDGAMMNVDGLGAKPLMLAPGVAILAGTIVQGSPYGALYNNTDGAFYLQGFFNSAYNVPFLAGMDYWDTVSPGSNFIFPAGQAISRTVYAKAFARWGTKYGSGDGSTTFNAPNVAGRVRAMIESAASLLTSTYFGADSTQIGSVGGSDHHALTLTEAPTGIQSSVSVTSPSSGFLTAPSTGFAINSFSFNAGGSTIIQAFGNGAGLVPVTNITSTGTGASNNTGGQPHAICQPTITCNYVIRVA